MFETIKARLLLIAALVGISLWALYPEKVETRRTDENGRVVVDTSNQYIKLGLDLRGGIHMALELDESRTAIPKKDEAIDRALSVIRNRIDEFGVAEPLIQKEGSGRIVVELPGVADPERAKSIVQRSAFLAFHLTDEDDVFRTAIPAMDRALTAAGVSEASVTRGLADSAGQGPRAPGSAVEDILGGAAPDPARGRSAA